MPPGMFPLPQSSRVVEDADPYNTSMIKAEAFPLRLLLFVWLHDFCTPQQIIHADVIEIR